MNQWGMTYAKLDTDTDVPVEATDPNNAATDPLQQTSLLPRLFRFKPGPTPSATRQIAVWVADGTSLTVEAWVRDETLGNERWWRIGTATIAAGNVGLFQGFPGALTFVRVTTNTGNVKRYAVGQT